MLTHTRSESMAAFIHVRDTLMMRDASSYLAKALQVEGIDDISSLISMTKADVKSLHCLQETLAATDTVDQVRMTDLPLKLSGRSSSCLSCLLNH
jgi:hypothetical protein